MKNHDELENWRWLWLSQPAATIHLIRKVERQTVYMQLGRIAEILVTVFVGGGLSVWAIVKWNLDIALVAFGAWAFLLFAWRASVGSTRDVWSAGEATVTSYLDLAIERCRRSVAGMRAINALVLGETVFGLLIGNKIVADLGRWKPSSFLISLSISTVVAVALVLMTQAIKRRKLQPELEYLLRLRRQLSGDDESEPPTMAQ